VLEGAATLGIASPLGVHSALATRALSSAIPMVPVVSPRHPLASLPAPISTMQLSEHVQVVLSERNAEGIPDQAVLSPRTWRVADLATKRAMLLRGLGWGNLPSHLAARDLAEGRLVRIRPAAWAEHEHTLSFYAVHRVGEPLGRAHAHLLESLEHQCANLAAAAIGAGGERANGERANSERAGGAARPNRVQRGRSRAGVDVGTDAGVDAGTDADTGVRPNGRPTARPADQRRR
jgi:hypothetical protein